MNKHQKGSALIYAVIAVLVIMSGVTAFMNRSGMDTRYGGSIRDAELARLLADSAMNRVYGRFIANGIGAGDENGDGTYDRLQAWSLITGVGATLPLDYGFYVQTVTMPEVIRRVAAGDAAGTTCAITNADVTPCTALSVNDLFGLNSKPVLFVQTDRLSASAAADWTSETAKNKAAVWLEYVSNPKHAKWLDIYISSTSQVGRARAYVQKYLGSYTDELGGMIAPITESAIHGGGNTALDTCVTC